MSEQVNWQKKTDYGSGRHGRGGWLQRTLCNGRESKATDWLTLSCVSANPAMTIQSGIAIATAICVAKQKHSIKICILLLYTQLPGGKMNLQA
ncbi:hypothetical protein ACO0LM_09560 [Undibacterium sp. Di26W]|uniref:hypothetical protein n=1 Tax=Undibacterium sp. Di26W TaxID=3413035 RepID=UPI003BF3AC6D